MYRLFLKYKFFFPKQRYLLSYFQIFLIFFAIRLQSAFLRWFRSWRHRSFGIALCAHPAIPFFSILPWFLQKLKLVSKGSSVVSVTKSQIQCCSATFAEFLTELYRENFLLSYLSDTFLRNTHFSSNPIAFEIPYQAVSFTSCCIYENKFIRIRRT